MVRTKLKISPAELPDKDIALLITALDDDQTGTVSAVELEDFIEHGTATFYSVGGGGGGAGGGGEEGEAAEVAPWTAADAGSAEVDGGEDAAAEAEANAGGEDAGVRKADRRRHGLITKKQLQIRKFQRDIDTALAPGAPVTLHATCEPARILRKSRRRRLPGANRMNRSKYDVPIPGVPPPVWEALESKKGLSHELHPAIAGLTASTPPLLNELFLSDIDAVLAIQWRRW